MFCDMTRRICLPGFLMRNETKCINTEFHAESTGVFGFSIYSSAHNSAFTIGSTVNVRLVKN